MPEFSQYEFAPRKFVQVMSYGGGKDSFCMLITAIARGELPDEIVFMDVGNPRRHPVNLGPKKADPAEWLETYDHILDVAAPMAKRHGIPFRWIIAEQPTGALARRMRKAGIIPELYEIRAPKTEKAKLKSPALGLFDYMWRTGTVPVTANQVCQQASKIERFNDWLAKAHKGAEVEVWIGFNANEQERVETGKTYELKKIGKGGTLRTPRFPLAEDGLTKQDCVALMKRKRLPVPVKSACTFCPFGKDWEWVDLFQRYPETFYRIVDLWERKGVTDQGYTMFAKSFKKYELSPPQYEVLKLVARGAPVARDQVPGKLRTSFDAVARRRWVTQRGELSRYGAAILREAKRGPPQPGSGKALDRRKDIVWLASNNHPILGVHYEGLTLEEWIAGLLEEEQTPDVCVTKVRRRSNPELETYVAHLDVHGGPDLYQHEYRITATIAGRPVGHLAFSVLGGEAHVGWVEVPKRFRRQGIGSALYNRLYMFAAHEKLRVVHGQTTPEGAALVGSLGLPHNPEEGQLPARTDNLVLIRVTRPDVLVPQYLFYVLLHWYQAGILCELFHGTAQQCVRVKDLRQIPLGSQQQPSRRHRRDQPLRLKDVAEVNILGRKQLRPDDILLMRIGDGKPYFVRCVDPLRLQGPF